MAKPLTYRSSGVDLSENLEANEGIAKTVPQTFTSRVVTKPGLFAGVIDLEGLLESQPHLQASIGVDARKSQKPRSLAKRVFSNSMERNRVPGRSLAFLDYVAASPLRASIVTEIVEGFCEQLMGGDEPIPLIGGETAEMPGVFQDGQLELTGTLLSLCEESGPSTVNLLEEARGLENPCLALSMDGVGTKTRLLHRRGQAGSALLDILNHSLGDLLCLGARTLGLSLYVGCHESTRDLRALQGYVRHLLFSKGLQSFDFILHEVPHRYLPGEVDLVGCVAGLVDRDKILTGERIEAGDILIGIPSSGLHTNGYSLIHRLLSGLDQAEVPGWVIEGLLQPHKDHATDILPLLEGSDALRGIAHITGGGIQENLVRVLPQGLGAHIDMDSWEIPDLFRWIEEVGAVPFSDPVGKGMLQTFNLGIGLILVVDPSQSKGVLEQLKAKKEHPVILGQVEENLGGLTNERIHCISGNS
ncbi:hypothetical protein HOF92_00895 [bacterium]|nr:hypothetical protein [bacterium]